MRSADVALITIIVVVVLALIIVLLAAATARSTTTGPGVSGPGGVPVVPPPVVEGPARNSIVLNLQQSRTVLPSLTPPGLDVTISPFPPGTRTVVIPPVSTQFPTQAITLTITNTSPTGGGVVQVVGDRGVTLIPAVLTVRPQQNVVIRRVAVNTFSIV